MGLSLIDFYGLLGETGQGFNNFICLRILSHIFCRFSLNAVKPETFHLI